MSEVITYSVLIVDCNKYTVEYIQYKTYIVSLPSGELQTLNISFNSMLKDKMRHQFTECHAEEVSTISADELHQPIDLCSSLIKPLHANWLVESMADISADGTSNIISGWRSPEIRHAIDEDTTDSYHSKSD